MFFIFTNNIVPSGFTTLLQLAKSTQYFWCYTPVHKWIIIIINMLPLVHTGVKLLCYRSLSVHTLQVAKITVFFDEILMCTSGLLLS